MASIKTLEVESEKTIQTILLDFMLSIDYSDFDDSFDAEMYYFNNISEKPLKETVTTVYKEGYGNANTLMKRAAPVGLLKSIPPTKIVKNEVVPVKEFDIRTITTELMKKLKLLTYHQKSEIAEKLALHFEEQFTYDQIVDDMSKYFKYDTNVTSRFSRTATNHVYNRSHLHRYRDIGIVPGTQYGAHIDDRTSEICRMLNGTIWAINDPNIIVPPSHFNCRSRLKPYFGGIPGERDYKKDFDPEFIAVAEETLEIFHTKYWDV